MDELDATTVEFLDEDYNDIDSKEKLSTDENECETEFCDITDALKSKTFHMSYNLLLFLYIKMNRHC